MILAVVKEEATSHRRLTRRLRLPRLPRQRKRPQPGKYDRYKDGGKKKRKLTATLDCNDIKILQQEARLNKLSEDSFACQYPMKIPISNGKCIDIIALIDTGANASNYISQMLFDRLSEAGCKAQQTSGSVRGGLNLKGQRVDFTKSMSFASFTIYIRTMFK